MIAVPGGGFLLTYSFGHQPGGWGYYVRDPQRVVYVEREARAPYRPSFDRSNSDLDMAGAFLLGSVL